MNRLNSFLISIFLLFTIPGDLTLHEKAIPENLSIGITQSSVIYVANTEASCGNFSPCFFNASNSQDFRPEGIGTGLKNAINYAKDNSISKVVLKIIAPYEISGYEILIDYPVTIEGLNSGLITYSGSKCDQPMLNLRSEITLKNLRIEDGSCLQTSRDLIYISGPENIIIDHNTLQKGQNAIVIANNLANVLVQFNQITENSGLAVARYFPTITSKLDVIANNIILNGEAYQIDCNGSGIIDHNYWGLGVYPTSASRGCTFNEGKRLGAPIVLDSTGVSAARKMLSTDFGSQMIPGFSAKSNTSGTEIIAVNHGLVEPFKDINLDSNEITRCSNFYDVFSSSLDETALVTLSFSYDYNSSCITSVESSTLCGSELSENVPLMWFDPKTNLTDGWDYAGKPPQGSGGSIYIGQKAECDTLNKTLLLDISPNGRPNFLFDLVYTPFFVAFDKATISSFTVAQQNLTEISLSWTTLTESNAQGFYILRLNDELGVYQRISDLIGTLGNHNTGSTYTYIDNQIDLSTTYSYKLEVINGEGETQSFTGPISSTTTASTSTITATRTQTRTATPMRTSTSTRTPYPTGTLANSATHNPYRSATPSAITSTPDNILTPSGDITLTPTLFLPDQNENEFTSTAIGSYATLIPTDLLTGRDLEKTNRYNPSNWWMVPIGIFTSFSLFLLIGAIYLRKK